MKKFDVAFRDKDGERIGDWLQAECKDMCVALLWVSNKLKTIQGNAHIVEVSISESNDD